MNVLFLTLLDFDTIDEPGIYTDLLREFARRGHKLFIVSPSERRSRQRTRLIRTANAVILKPRIGNMQKTNLFEKGISTLSIGPVYVTGIRKYFPDVRFDLVIYPTPPITFSSAIEYIRKRDHAGTYLLLKDIFPQNAVDLDMMSMTGWRKLPYQYFRNKEKKLYAISDHIGCMSQANVDYVIRRNPEVDPSIVGVCPNSIEVTDRSVDETTRVCIREKYGIPLNRRVFVYGGNLGRPQGIDFLIACLKRLRNHPSAYFLIVGDGTEYGKLEKFTRECPQENLKLMRRLPKEEYDTMAAACNVGLIFLDHRFTVPNFPSRMLSYMQAKLPVLACTDVHTDIGKVITEGGFGWWCESGSTAHFEQVVNEAMQSSLAGMGEAAMEYLREHYSVKTAYEFIMRAVGQ